VKTLANKLVIPALLLLFAGGLLAQPNPPTPLAMSEMSLKVETTAKEVVKDATRVQLLQIKARKDKDSVRLTCINDKLLQINALRNIFDGLYEAFQATAKQESYDQILATASGIRQLREQAQLCAGETQFISDMQGGYAAPDIPDDPSVDLFPEGTEPPGFASPFN
jgi:hypothetical protein